MLQRRTQCRAWFQGSWIQIPNQDRKKSEKDTTKLSEAAWSVSVSVIVWVYVSQERAGESRRAGADSRAAAAGSTAYSSSVALHLIAALYCAHLPQRITILILATAAHRRSCSCCPDRQSHNFMKAELLLSLQHNTYRQEDFEVANDCKIRALAFRNVTLATK